MKTKKKISIEKLVDRRIEKDKEWLKDEIKNMRFNGILVSAFVLAWDIIHYEDLIEMERFFHKHPLSRC